MLRLKAAAAIALVAVVACGRTTPPTELHTAAAPPAVVQVEGPRPDQAREIPRAARGAEGPTPPITTTTTLPPAPPPTSPPAPERATVRAATAPGGGAGDPNDDASWDRLAGCESGGNWSINTGNGYYGGIQFSLGSWRAVGGTGYPHEHSREVQIEMGRRLWAQGGWGHWPGCTRSFGWR